MSSLSPTTTPTPPKLVLGNAYNPSADYEPQVLWSALRGIMLGALSYTDSRPGLPPARLTQYRLQTLACEQEICERLADTPAYATYLALDAQVQQHVLFENKEQPAPARSFDQLMNDWLAAQAAAAGEAGATAWTQRLVLLQALKCIVPARRLPDDPGDERLVNYRHHAGAWSAYYAWRKVALINALEQAFYLNDYVFDRALLNQQLAKGSDLGLRDPQAFLAAPVLLRAGGPAPGAARPNPAISEYESAKSNLKTLGDELTKATKSLSTAAGQKELDAYAQTYASITQKQAAYTYLLEQKRAELPLTTSLKEKARDYIAGNRQNTSLVLKEAGMALIMSSGLTLGKALVSWGKGEPIDPKLGEKLMTGLLIGVGTAAVTYLLGPVGPMVSNLALGYFFPQPDPVRDGLKNIQSAVDLGFRQTEKRFDELKTQIEEGFANVIREIGEALEHGAERDRLVKKIDDYQRKINDADRVLSDMDNAYTALFVSGDNTVQESRLLDLHTDFTNLLDELVKLFYNAGYHLATARLDTARKATHTPLAEELIRFYQRPGRSFKPFHAVCAEISAISARLRLLVLRYFEIRPRYQATLAAVTVLFDTEKPKRAMTLSLIDLHRSENNERAAYFAGVMMLDRLVLGAANYTLYQNLLTRRLALTDGLGLALATDPRSQWQLAPGTRAGGEDAWFQSVPLAPTPNRYYLRLPPAPKEPYQLLSAGDTDWPLATPLHLALDLDDHLMLHDPEFRQAVKAQVLTLHDPAFVQSFEQFLLADRLLPLAELYARPDHRLLLTLPRRGYQLELSVRQTPYAGSDRQPLSEQFRTMTGAATILAGIDPAVAFWAPQARILDPQGRAVAQWALPSQVPFLVNVASAMATTLRPYHTPDAVGLLVEFPFCQYMTSGGQYFEWQKVPFLPEPLATGSDQHGLLRYGVWDSAQALGAFRPAWPDAPAVLQQPFRDMLFPEQKLTSLRSANGQYWLQFDRHRTDESILSLYHNGQRGRSVFDRYTYKDNQFVVNAWMQKEGNFVLYDPTGYGVAATHTHGKDQTFLHLTDDGRLLLRWLHNGAICKTLDLHDVHVWVEGRRNRWFSGNRIDQDGQLHSANGQYRLDFMHHQEPSGIVYNTGIIPEPDQRDWTRHGFSLTIYRDGKQHARTQKASLLSPPVSHNPHSDQDFVSNEYWHHCSDEMISYIDRVVKNSSQVRTMLDIHSNGEITGSVVTRQTILGIKSYYGVKPIHTLYQPKQAHPQGVYLRLTDEGKLQVHDTVTGQVVATLL